MDGTGPRQRSLMDKLKEHYHSRDSFAPKPEEASRAGMTFFWSYATVCVLSTSFITVPQLWKDDDTLRLWNYIFIWFVFLETVTNWFLCARLAPNVYTPETDDNADANAENGALIKAVAQGWRICLICQIDAPPRSHHCKLCQACVLKRDHHCFFTGTCIAFKNQRRFLVLTFYMAVASAYVFISSLWFVDPELKILTSEFYIYLPGINVLSWIQGYVNIFQMIMLTLSYVSVVTFPASIGFFCWIWFLTLRGQTTYEIAKNIHVFRVGGVISHLQKVWGSVYLIPLHYLVPIYVPLPGDGAHWEMQKSFKNH